MHSDIRSQIMDEIPTTRGIITQNAPLAGINWFRTGGNAEVLFQPADAEDLRSFLTELKPRIPITVLGLGSNSLIRDGGVPGIVIHLGKNFNEINFDCEDILAGAGALDVAVSRACRDHSLTGLEFLNGIPGTIGGALRMNAGAYGREIADVLISAKAFDRSGKIHELSAKEFGFAYRHIAIEEDWIFVSARMRGLTDDRTKIDARMSEIASDRRSSQPIQQQTSGSTFKNPPGQKAWQLIEAAGCRGLSVGDAVVSEQHCNFLINLGTATAKDLETLGEEVRDRVKRQSGVLLEWEIKRIGIPLGGIT